MTSQISRSTSAQALGICRRGQRCCPRIHSHNSYYRHVLLGSKKATFEDPCSAVNGGYIKPQGYVLRNRDLPSDRKRLTISETEADKMESYFILDQSGTWSPESSWVPNLLAFLLRSRHTSRPEQNDGVSGKTNTTRKPTCESFWLLSLSNGESETDGT